LEWRKGVWSGRICVKEAHSQRWGLETAIRIWQEDSERDRSALVLEGRAVCQRLWFLGLESDVIEDPADARIGGDERDDFHPSAAVGTQQRIDFVHLLDELSPGQAAAPAKPVRIVLLLVVGRGVEGEVLVGLGVSLRFPRAAFA